MSREGFEYERKNIGTGYHPSDKDYITRVYAFSQYLITVKLSLDERFIGIEEVKVNKDFRSYKQKASKKIHRVVDEYEPEPE